MSAAVSEGGAAAPVVRIARIASGGDGVGRLDDGRTVFVPRTAPGDLVELAHLRLERRLARARIGRILEPSPDRVPPPCPHYVADDCGGCQLQHMAAPAQREARRGIVGDALRRLARLDVPDPPLVPATRDLGYRTKLTLHVSSDGRRIGLHPYGRADRVFELDWCHITVPELNELWLACRRSRAKLPPRLVRIVLRLDRQGGRHLVLETGPGEVWSGGPALHAALAASGVSATVWWRPDGGAPRAVAGADTAFPATAFEQIHPEMGDRVRAHALARLGATGGVLVWDLYAGVGETTDLLLEAGARVESVESDRRAVAHAEERGRRGPVERHAARAEDAVGRLKRPDLVITNPPRTGMDARVTDALSQSGARRIVYVSCDPATLARDITRLAPRYRLAEITAFDLFPQTAHVESVAVLELV